MLLLEELDHFHDATDVIAHFVEQNFGGKFLVIDHEPVFGLVLGYEFDDDALVGLEPRALVDLGEAAVADVSAQLVLAQIGLRVELEVFGVLDELVFDVEFGGCSGCSSSCCCGETGRGGGGH